MKANHKEYVTKTTLISVVHSVENSKLKGKRSNEWHSTSDARFEIHERNAGFRLVFKAAFIGIYHTVSAEWACLHPDLLATGDSGWINMEERHLFHAFLVSAGRVVRTFSDPDDFDEFSKNGFVGVVKSKLLGDSSYG